MVLARRVARANNARPFFGIGNSATAAQRGGAQKLDETYLAEAKRCLSKTL